MISRIGFENLFHKLSRPSTTALPLHCHHVVRGVVGPRVALDGSHGEHAPPRSPLEGPHPVPEPLRRT